MKNILSLSLFFQFLLCICPHINATELSAPDGSIVSITRDDFGVPHIQAETESGVFFGQGYALAEDRMFQMDTWRRRGEGTLAEWFGYEYWTVDYWERIIGFTDEERSITFQQLPLETRLILESYTAGVNTWIDSAYTQPDQHLPLEYETYPLDYWTVEKSLALIEWNGRSFGADGGQELHRLEELQELGWEWFEANRPINDPDAPTTIHLYTPPQQIEYDYSGMSVPHHVLQQIAYQKEEIVRLERQLHIPQTLGSFAVLISPQRSASGGSMLLGAPQMFIPEYDVPAFVCEIELDCPTYHVSGMSIPGIPGVFTGRTQTYSFTLCCAKSDNIDVFIDSTETSSFERYWFNDEWHEFELIPDTIFCSDHDPIPFQRRRTVHGPAVWHNLEDHQVFSRKCVIWGNEITFMNTFIDAARQETITGFINTFEGAALGFNLLCAQNNGDILYAHVGVYPDRNDGVDPRLPRRGDGSEEWQGFMQFDQLPRASGQDQGYFVNWNNKPVSWWNNGDNMPWVGNDRVSDIDACIAPLQQVTCTQLIQVQEQINSRGTWQQASDWGNPAQHSCLCPPGQSGFISRFGIPDEHKNDQWPLHIEWQMKSWFWMDTSISPEDYNHHPTEFHVNHFFPNPCNSNANIGLELPSSSDVDVEVYNCLGREVVAFSLESLPAGYHRIGLPVENLASGLYLVSFVYEGNQIIRKMVVLK